MDIVTENNKKVLRDDTIAPFTICKAGDQIVLQEYVKVLRLGPRSAQWLFEALQVVCASSYIPEQALEHYGRKVLTIISELGYTYIISIHVRFVITRPVLVLLVEWLEQNLQL